MTQHELSPCSVALALLFSLVTIGLGASIVYATEVYLLAFLAVLAGVLFANLAKLIGRVVPLPYGANLAVAVVVGATLSAGTIFFFGWRIEHQLVETSRQLDQSYDKAVDWIDKSPTATSLFGRIPFSGKLLPDGFGQQSSNSSGSESDSQRSTDEGYHGSSANNENTAKNNGESSTSPGEFLTDSDDVPTGWVEVGAVNSVSGKVFGLLGKVSSTSLGATMNVAFILFVGVFLAADPHFYRDNVVRLFPTAQRSRVTAILNMLEATLFSWLRGRAATMVITGTGTSIVLWILGVPLALTLGIITGLLTFIPTIGSFLALLLCVLVALSQGPSTVAWVVVFYAILQFVESNVITPLIQQHHTSVPPPLLLTSQLMMGVLTGFLGVLIATPLMACLIVLVRETYVVDVLGDEEFK